MNDVNDQILNDHLDDLSVVLPCYNEEKNIEELYNRIILTIQKLKIKKYKVIFIDDGSSDKTWEKINLLKQKNINSIIGLKLVRNFGHQLALFAGLNLCKSKFILTMDADLQDPPELLEKMYSTILEKKVNIVLCQRSSSDEKIIKKITSKLFYYIFNIFSQTKIDNDSSDFKLFDRKVFETLLLFKENNPFIRGIISWTGYKKSILKFERPVRKHGRSGWAMSKMINFSIDAFFGFSTLPQRISFYFSLIFFIFFVLLLLFNFYSLLTGNINYSVLNYNLIILIISLLFLILGIITEYLGRSYNELKNRPKYLIEKILK